MRRILLPLLLFATLLVATAAHATGLRVTDVQPAGDEKARRVACTVTWRNGWKNARNHDAAWLFVKTQTQNGNWQHVRVAPDGHTTPAGAQLVIPPDRAGVFVIPRENFRGTVTWRVELALDPNDDGPGETRVLGLEMVYIPSGPFTLGDLDPKAVDFAAVYRSDARGEPAGLLRIASEDAVTVGAQDGALFYKTQHPEYEGDRQGPIPREFPKGFHAFYAMKYELTQGHYAAFLNMLPTQSTFFRAIHGGRGYAAGRGTIRLEESGYVAGTPDRPANWISWNDGLAFADWSGLRPMTELEFTKAARGPATPIAHEFPWGTATFDRLKRQMGPDDDLIASGDADESLLMDATRDVLGASHFWVMDLAGSVPPARATTRSTGANASNWSASAIATPRPKRTCTCVTTSSRSSGPAAGSSSRTTRTRSGPSATPAAPGSGGCRKALKPE